MLSFTDFTNKSALNKKIKQVINDYGNLMDKHTIPQLMMLSIAEKIIPLNIWFENPNFKIVDFYENEQHLRTRHYKNALLTPLVINSNKNFGQLSQCLKNMSLYQPFYPETFYGMWEIMSIEMISKDIKNILHIGNDDRLGTMEAMMLFLEKNQQTYQFNTYHCWLSGNEIYDDDDIYYLESPKIDYLSQAYKSVFLDSTDKLIKYDFVSIDVNHKFSNILEWKYDEEDLHHNLFYFMFIIKYLNNNGSLLIKMNMLCRDNWNILFYLGKELFKEVSFYRSTVCNPLNPEIYLFMNKFKQNNNFDEFDKITLKNLYRQQMYKISKIQKVSFNHNINDKYTNFVDKWVNDFLNAVSNISKLPLKEESTDMSLDWHTTYSFPQIGNLLDKTYIVDKKEPFGIFKTIEFPLKTSAKSFQLITGIPEILYKIPFYQKIISKRAELNFCKRIMDTKPSKIFIRKDEVENPMNKLVSWDHMMHQLDPHRRIKTEIKKNYYGELVTSAWVKMYDMLNNNIKIDINDDITTFHLCEAPGAFISATNHYLSSNYPNHKWNWYAQTLKPINNINPDALKDHFGMIKNYPNRWLFGENNTGDITNSSVIRSYASDTRLKTVDFMTSDAGLKCHPRDLNEQEAHMAKINMGQITCILACLSVGKSAIFGTFLPLTEPLDISMIYLVTHLFNVVKMVKPIGSHSHNSEIYLILEGYKGIKQSVLESLYQFLDDPKITSKSLLFGEIDKTFFNTYYTGISSLVDQQIQSLLQYYYYYFTYDNIVVANNDEYFNKWFQNNPIEKLNRSLL